MIKNYFKIAWRNLLKYKLFSFINIIGLSLAIPSALMALIQIVNYYEYDNFHQDEGRIVRIITDEKLKDGTITSWASSPVPLAGYLEENLPGIDNSATIVRDSKWVLSNGIKTKNINAIYTDESFFDIFNFPLEKGTYPVELNSIVLTHETAEWFFNDTNPIGSILEHPRYGGFKVVGVLKHFNKQKTQFRTDLFVPFSSYLNTPDRTRDWSTLNAHTFVKLSQGVARADFDRQLSGVSGQISKFIKTEDQKSLLLKAQYLTEISPSKTILENDPYVQDIRSIYLNFAFQLIMILLASLNYINLTLARSMNRSREVGVRKVAGATKTQLVLQFLVESVLVSYIALSIGLLLLWFVKRYIHVSWLTWEIDHLGYLIGLFFVFNLMLGLVAGVFPSLILSSYQPVKVLKGTVSPVGFGRIGFRKSLIIVQFTIALVYIFFIGHGYHQINYMAHDNENYQRKDILNVNVPAERYRLLSTELSTIKEVQQIGYTSLTFGNTPTQSAIKSDKNSAEHPAYFYAADRQYIENMGLKIVAGTNLLESNSDSASSLVVVNQKTVERLNLGSEKDAIGKPILLNDSTTVTIAGVVANFCHYDYEKKIEPVVFQYRPSLFKVMCLKTSPGSDREALEASVAGTFKKFNPYQEMNAQWLDTEMYERYYPYATMRFMGMEGLVIFVIAILGMIGILTYSLEKRTKEIGIRKVIGATTAEIIRLMSKDFIKLLVIATIIAIPAGVAIGFYMNTYLVFNNGISYLTMSLLLTLVLSFALGAVGYFSWRAAQTNPAVTLKAE